jgi:hypothetical protein
VLSEIVFCDFYFRYCGGEKTSSYFNALHLVMNPPLFRPSSSAVTNPLFFVPFLRIYYIVCLPFDQDILVFDCVYVSYSKSIYHFLLGCLLPCGWLLHPVKFNFQKKLESFFSWRDFCPAVKMIIALYQDGPHHLGKISTKGSVKVLPVLCTYFTASPWQDIN